MAKITTGTTDGDIKITPNGTGKTVVGSGAASATVQSSGNHDLVLQTGNATTGSITITDGASGNIAITPNGTGEVDISKVDIDGGAIDGTVIGGTDPAAGTFTDLTATSGTINSIQPASGQSLTIKDEDGNTAITIGTDNTAHTYLSLNFGSYHGDSGIAGTGTRTGNTLDDYEEGTWASTSLSSLVNVTFSGATTFSGRYTKIGNKVTLSTDAAGVPTGTIAATNTFTKFTINGLPFSSASGQNAFGVVWDGYREMAGVCFMSGSTSSIFIYFDDISVGFTGSVIPRFSITYEV